MTSPIDVSSLSFQDWIEFTFALSAEESRLATEPYWPENTVNMQVVIDFCTRLFQDPKSHLKHYSDSELVEGFRFIVFTNGYLGSFFWEPSVEDTARAQCIRAVYDLNAKLFVDNPLGGICREWWDLFPTPPGPENEIYEKNWELYSQEALLVFPKILSLPCEHCRYSALFGLNWLVVSGYRAQAGMIVDEFLDTHPDVDSNLRQYALDCQAGTIT